ncbi:patatin-like phospholipase family protein [Bizionia gelidisalsuginis]|uniref:Patatin-like phospholipase family protein n=1 Tax=Bizionia gelidisalsuginis TaxID=291188 RepID=A0ABY3M8I5_9FLAO|nr:patatin-like phospholipase family protein [Bizionia gelidisalsuginis]TYC10553.1 patatin-like phospholipase family protein [Bizionia gelidisalsuginis]
MNTGLVLSGGGARGAAHIGAIKALEENSIFPTHIAGTSAGAIVGALYAAGVSWSEILNFYKTISIFQASRYARNKPGFINSANFYDDLKAYLPNDNFETLKKTLFITASNIIDGTLKIFSKGQLIKPIIASASFPGVFTPTEINGKFYVDGGVINNFPIEPLKNTCDKIIGVYVNPLKKISIKDLKHSYTVIERAYKIKNAVESMAKFSACDIMINPQDLSNYGTFDMNSIDAIFNVGYTATLKALAEHKIVLS